jgi:hypothetical protein
MNQSIININKRFIYLTALVIFLFATMTESVLNAQAQKSWQWVKQLGSRSWDISAGIAIDSKNNIFVAGSFYDTLNCNNKKIISSGSQDLFVAMFNENGSLEEFNHAGGTGVDLATCISITPEDNLVIGGMISDSVMFGESLAPGFGSRLFIAEMDSRGKFLWVSTIAVTGDASIFTIGTDSDGSYFASGCFVDTLITKDQKVISIGKKDVFLVRLNKAGEIEKLISFGGEEDDSPGSLSIDASGNVVLSGIFGKSFVTNGMKFSTSPNVAKTNSFISMFDRDLRPVWVNTLQGNDFVQIASLKHDISGNIFAAGTFNSSLKISDSSLISSGYTDAFILKYKTDGNLDWAKSFGSWYYDYATSVNIDNLGGAIITGSIGDTLVVDSLVIEPISKDNSAIVIQFSPNGKAIWADNISGTGRNFSNASVLDKEGNLYFTGSFRNKFEKENITLTSFGDQDIFVAKYYNCLLSEVEIFGNRTFCKGIGTELSVKRGYTNVVWNDTITGKNSIIADKPGLCKVSLLDKKGCPLKDSIFIKENPLPLFSLGNDTILFVSDSLYLHAPDNYTINIWKDYSSGPEYLAKPFEKNTGIMEYWLTVTDSLSCNYSDTISITWMKNHEWVDLEKIQLITYPNPTDENFYWYLKADETCQLVAELADGNGRILYYQFFREYIPGEIKEVNLNNMPSGIYNMKIGNSISGNTFKTVRVIKR